MPIFLRVSRHPMDGDRLTFVQNVFGDAVRIVTKNIEYGPDPVSAVKELIARTAVEGDHVVAIEAQAPFPVLMQLVNASRTLGAPVVRAQFERGADGRALVIGQDESGRDLLKFSHYEELVRIEFETRRLGQ